MDEETGEDEEDEEDEGDEEDEDDGDDGDDAIAPCPSGLSSAYDERLLQPPDSRLQNPYSVLQTPDSRLHTLYSVLCTLYLTTPPTKP